MNLPAPFEDELSYSVLARFADQMGTCNAASFGQLVFGVPRVRPIVEFPSRLDALLPRLLPGSPYGAVSLVKKHSLFPYFSSFLSKPRAQIALDDVIAGRAAIAFGRLCINSIRNTLRLRFCEACISQDLHAGREPYWRRVHQLPGSIICVRHGYMLKEGVSVRGVDRIGFVSISRMLSEGSLTHDLHTDAPKALLFKLASSSQALLDRPDAVVGGDLGPAFYEMLRAAGWANGKRLAATNIMDHVRGKFGDDILAQISVHHRKFRSAAEPRKHGHSTDWLANCLRVRGSIAHPLPYILILTACDLGAADLLAFSPQETAPPSFPLERPCANSLCTEYDPPVPRPLSGTIGDGMRLIRCPNCGFAYRQDGNCAQRKAWRISDFGDLWDAALRSECESGDASVQEIERRLGCPIQTIKRRAIDLGVWNPRWSNQSRSFTESLSSSSWEARRARSRERYRSNWLALATKHPCQGRRALGRHDEVTYAFLREFDSEWLDSTTPLVPRGMPRPTPDAERKERDAKLATLIDAAADAIARSDEPQRITRNAIARALGRTSLRISPVCMPLSTAAIRNRVETAADFAERKTSLKAPTAEAWDGYTSAHQPPSGIGGHPAL